jgi:hypothetical protein
VITEQQSFAYDIRDAFFNVISADTFFNGFTAKKNKMLPVQLTQLPYLGVYLVDETMTPDGDDNAGCVRFTHLARIGFSVIVVNNDQIAGEKLSDQAYLKIGTLLFTNSKIFNMIQSNNPEGVLIEGVARGTRRHLYGNAGLNNETPFIEMQYEIYCKFRTEWYPDIVDTLDEIDVTTGIKQSETQADRDQRQQVKVVYSGLQTKGNGHG